MIKARNPLLIIGAGGHGKVVAHIARAMGYEVYGFADRDAQKVGQEVGHTGLKVQYLQQEIMPRILSGDLGFSVAVAIGQNDVRLKLIQAWEEQIDLPILVHPSAILSPSAKVLRGTQICPHVVVHPDAKIGKGVILNTHAIVEHDCIVEDGVHISPGAVLAGHVHVGRSTWIGARAVVINDVKIGHHVIVGAGAVVIRDLPDHVTAVGNPARIIKKHR